MKYNVEILDSFGSIKASYTGLKKKEAMEKAKKESKDEKQAIFISWFRKSDGQHGYLNADGNHDITGKRW